MIVTPTK